MAAGQSRLYTRVHPERHEINAVINPLHRSGHRRRLQRGPRSLLGVGHN